LSFQPAIEDVLMVESSLERDCLVHALEYFPVGVILADSTGAILYTNAAAAEAVHRDDGLHVHHNQLTALNRGEDLRLRALIGGRRSGGVLISHPERKHPYQVWVVPLHATRSTRSRCVATLVFVCDSEHARTDAEEVLEDFYDFTPSEARLANQLMNGATLSDSASALGIRLQTAKSHLKRIFSKTHTQRQSELVHLLMLSVATLRLGNEPTLQRAQAR
jgi:DNA-binding CsgD family transcriptional regulator